jgi:hypothetical protein
LEKRKDEVTSLQEKLKAKIKYKNDILSRAVVNLQGSSKINQKNELAIIQKTELIDVNLKSDYNESLLSEFGANLREIDQNVKDTAVNLKGQGENLVQMTKILKETDTNIDRANKTLNSLSWGQRIQLILIHFIAFLLFIAIIILAILRFMRQNN